MHGFTLVPASKWPCRLYAVYIGMRRIGSVRLMPDGWMALGGFAWGRWSSKGAAAGALAKAWLERRGTGRQ